MANYTSGSKTDKNRKQAPAKRSLPVNADAEQSLLGCIMADGSVALEITAELTPDDFYSNANQLIYEAMQNIVKGARPIDVVTLSDELDNMGSLEDAGGVSYLTEIMQSVIGTANYKNYAEIVKKNSLLRRLIRASQDIIEQTYRSENQSDALSFAEKVIYDISNSMDTSSLVNMSDAFSDVLIKFGKIQSDRNAFRGLPTGFRDLDAMTNGLQNSDLILIAARPGVGKTSFSSNIIENISVFNNKVSAVFSLEMSRQQLAQRMICSVAGVSMEKALKGNLTKHDWDEIWKANELVSNAKIFVDDTALVTPREMLSKCRRLKLRYGLDVVMIDYIQLMRGDDRRYDGRQQEVADISRNLKVMAKELNVPVIALSQLSREAEKVSRPQLSHLRESGAIEQDADIVMFIHRPDRAEENADKVRNGLVPKDVAEIIIAKHRNGPLGSVSLKWIGEMTKFINLDRQSESLEKTYNLAPKGETAPPPARVPPADMAEIFPPTEPDGAHTAASEKRDRDAKKAMPPIDHGAMPPFDPDPGELSSLQDRSDALPPFDTEDAPQTGFTQKNDDDMFD